MNASLKNKIALVTGGGSGIGRAVALAFADSGAKVVVADIEPRGGQATTNAIVDAGGQAIFARTDIAQASQVQTMINKTIQANMVWWG